MCTAYDGLSFSRRARHPHRSRTRGALLGSMSAPHGPRVTNEPRPQRSRRLIRCCGGRQLRGSRWGRRSPVDQPTNVAQAAQRPPAANEVVVDGRAVTSDDVVEVLGVADGECREVEQRVAGRAFGPVDDGGDLVALDEDVVDLQIAVDERRSPRPQHRLGERTIAGHDIGGHHPVANEPVALGRELGPEAVGVRARPRRGRRVVHAT